MILTSNIEHQYPGGENMQFPDISCAASDKLMILGQSGTGKTSMLHILGGMLKPNKGSVEIAGKDIYSLSPSALDYHRGKHIGVIFQQAHFIKSLNVIENIRLDLSLSGVPRKDDELIELMAKLNIDHKANAFPENLSQGEKQRAAIARALAKSPKLVLADEPTSALDDKNCFEVLKLLEEQTKESGAALILVTHDNRLIDHFSNKIILS